LYINDNPQAISVNLALFADDTCLYATERKQGHVLRKLKRGLNSTAARCKCWNIKINEERLGKSTSPIRPPDTTVTLNGRNIPFVNGVKCLDVIFDKKIAWRLRIGRVTTKAYITFIRFYSLLK
jgi:hypothetical protein